MWFGDDFAAVDIEYFVGNAEVRPAFGMIQNSIQQVNLTIQLRLGHVVVFTK